MERERERSRVRLRAAWCFALALGLALAAALGAIVRSTQWTMDADEAVHAVEALRLHDHLVNGRVGAFLHDTYFPERWHPPVQPNVRWYPFVHPWLLQPFFLVLGPSDVSARLPSVFLMVGAALLLFELARRLSPRWPAASGLLASLLFLAAPNVQTFSAQSLVAAASCFFTFLAALAYLFSLEKEHPLGRALAAGIALGLAALTKYDHGGFLALSLGLAELVRVRFSVARFLRSGAAVLFGTALAMIVIWFAHPDKLAALVDSVRHPFPPSFGRVAVDTTLSMFVEYGTSLAVGVGALVALVTVGRRRDEPAVRAIWLWGVLSVLFYVVRGRFYFRYNIVEAPLLLLFLALELPRWIEVVGRWLARPAGAAARGWGIFLWLASALGVAAGIGLLARPDVLLDREDGTTRFWLQDVTPFFAFLGISVIATALALFFLVTVRLGAPNGVREPLARRLVAGAFALAVLPGLVASLASLERRVEWELEGHPALAEVHARIGAALPARTRVLLAGGWDQLTNNALRWTLLTQREPRAGYDDVRVEGDMIGTIVLPAEPRVAYWREQLATAPTDELPDHVVILRPTGSFLYDTLLGNEADAYEEVLASRPCYRTLVMFEQADVGVRVTVLERDQDVPPLTTPIDPKPYVPARPGSAGWLLLDDSLRHFTRAAVDR